MGIFRMASLVGALLMGGAFAMMTPAAVSADQVDDSPKVALVIHGGAGTILPQNMTAEQEQAYRAKLEEALRAGYKVLQQGGTSTEAVVAAIQVMEDSPLFNAGRGAVFTNAATVELDASIMEGSGRHAGAVASIKEVKSPIALARTVMQHSPHVMLVGEGAETFAREQGLEMVPNTYFHTERRRSQLERIKAQERQQQEEGTPEDKAFRFDDSGEPAIVFTGRKYGTVGAVALDAEGNLAAGTSTGGMTNKRWGRVGDSPIIGAGTYADNETCAVSATGHGEFFIRGAVAYDVAAMMRYTGLPLVEAANAVIHGRLSEMGGTGGIIAMDREGNIVMPFNTPGMYRGYIDTEGNMQVKFYRE